ncbi:MAG: hypothetical protein EU530_06260 [Promethearchaeota archaeon]|nr:MAG: hypothetical protein EU530_06260 [Candidatus Lokiarchaeota archaeon]
MVIADLIDGSKEVFRFRELLAEVVMATIDTPDYILDKIFKVYQDFVELVETMRPFTPGELTKFINTELLKYSQQPFFPVLAGLYVNAMINKLFQQYDELEFDITDFCDVILNKAESESMLADENADFSETVGFSLDYVGYLLPDHKKLIIRGAVGDFSGALMGEKSEYVLHGMHGRYFGYEKHPTAKISLEG